MSDFSPIYGQNPSGTQTALQCDASGNLKTTAAGSGTSAVNLTQINGVAVSSSNPLPVSSPSSTSTLTSVASSSSSVTLLASNANRKGAYFYNESVFLLYIAFAATAATSAYTVQVPAGCFYEMPTNPVYQGAIAGIWNFVNGNVRITELT